MARDLEMECKHLDMCVHLDTSVVSASKTVCAGSHLICLSISVATLIPKSFLGPLHKVIVYR